MGFRLRRNHQHNMVNVRRHRLQLTKVVRPLQQGMALLPGHDHPGIVRPLAPGDPVAGHQAVDIGPHKATEQLALMLPLQRLDIQLLAVMGNDQPRLFRPQLCDFVS